MEIQRIVKQASEVLERKVGYRFDQLDIAKPTTQFEALNLLKITSKLSPFVGNLLEIEAVETLTKVKTFKASAMWVRQDPGFPDVLYKTGAPVEAGFEVKAWYPFATEITGRFKDSQNRFAHDQTQGPDVRVGARAHAFRETKASRPVHCLCPVSGRGA